MALARFGLLAQALPTPPHPEAGLQAYVTGSKGQPGGGAAAAGRHTRASKPGERPLEAARTPPRKPARHRVQSALRPPPAATGPVAPRNLPQACIPVVRLACIRFQGGARGARRPDARAARRLLADAPIGSLGGSRRPQPAGKKERKAPAIRLRPGQAHTLLARPTDFGSLALAGALQGGGGSDASEQWQETLHAVLTSACSLLRSHVNPVPSRVHFVVPATG